MKLIFRNVSIALVALTLGGCDLCDCICHKKKGPNWAAIDQARFGSGGDGGGLGGTGGGGGSGGSGGGNSVPEISPHTAVAGLTLLGGLGLILADCRRSRRPTNCIVPP